MKTHKQRFHTTLVILTAAGLLVLAVLGYSVWFALHSSHLAELSLQSANKVSNDVPKVPVIATFTACQKAPRSVLLQTYPEQCVTAGGKKFTDAQKYLTIKEWQVRVPLGSAVDAGAYYTVNKDQPSANPVYLTVYATETDQLVGPAGVSCKGEYVAYLLRLPKDDPKWQPATSVDDGNIEPIYQQRTVIGNYKYAIATHKEYGPDCFETTQTGSYKPDTVTSQKFAAVVSAFSADFKNITAN